MKAVKFNKRAAQGDILITKISKLPDGLELSKAEKSYHIVTHSETGHHHVIEANRARLLIDRTNAFIAYLNVLEPCEIEHLRSFDTHAPISLDPGFYEIRRQREYTPQGWRKAQD
jgi:hypothetical protein